MQKSSITIEYARSRLGDKAKHMTDEQIADILSMLRLLCNKTIDSVLKQNEN